MTNRKLKNDPILEAMFEVRFSTIEGVPTDIISGVLYKELSSDYPVMESLPGAQIPKEIREKEPNFAYSTTHKFSNENFAISVGPQSFVITCTRPYKHWEGFKPVIMAALSVLNKSNLVKNVTRAGLRYVNLIPSVEDVEEQFSQLNLSCHLGEYDLLKSRTNIRTEIIQGGFKNVVSINSGARVKFSNEENELVGVILDIDTICDHDLHDFFAGCSDILDKMHDSESSIFFKSISDKALEELNS